MHRVLNELKEERDELITELASYEESPAPISNKKTGSDKKMRRQNRKKGTSQRY